MANSKRKMFKEMHDDRCKLHLQEGLKMVTGINYDEKEIRKKYRAYWNKITIPWLDIRITDACTLKCKHCTEWNPYLMSKRIFSSEEVIQDIKKLEEFVDYIFGISLIGGEPLVNANIDEILEYCINSKKIGYIVITTNGTLMPGKNVLKKLENKKVKTILSRYDDGKKDIYLKLFDYLIQHNCNYFVFDSFQKFVDLGMPRVIQKESAEDTFDKYISCWCRNCGHFAEGKLYRCSRTYAGIKMGIFNENDVRDEIIDINVIHNKRQCRTMLKKFYSLPYLNTCTTCLPANKRRIYKPAIQIGGELDEY